MTSSHWPWLWLSGGQRPPPTKPPPPADRRPPPTRPPHRPYTNATTSNRPASSYDKTTSGRPASSSCTTNSDQPASSTDYNPSGCTAYAAAAGRCCLFDFVTMPSVATTMTLAIVVSMVVAAVNFSVTVAVPVAVVLPYLWRLWGWPCPQLWRWSLTVDATGATFREAAMARRRDRLWQQ